MAEWCWVHSGALGEAGSLSGPFKTREEALNDAIESFNPESFPIKIVLGRVKNIVPADYPPRFDTYDVLESMEEALADDDLAFEDCVFGLSGPRDDAEEALREALRAWIREWVESDGWILDDDGKEELTLDGKFTVTCANCKNVFDSVRAGVELCQACDAEVNPLLDIKGELGQ